MTLERETKIGEWGVTKDGEKESMQLTNYLESVCAKLKVTSTVRERERMREQLTHAISTTYCHLSLLHSLFPQMDEPSIS